MRGRRTAGSGLRLRVFGIPFAVLAVLALSELSVEPVRYPAVTGEHRLESKDVDSLGRSEPIALTTTAVGLTWPRGGSSDAAVRVSDDGATWGPWVPVHADDHGPDADSGEGDDRVASEAVYTGGAGWLQVEWEGSVEPVLEYVDTTGSTVSLSDRVTAQLGRLRWGAESRVLASPEQPEILPRSAWGGQDCVAEDVEYSTRTRVEVLMVHHTIHSANANAYSSADVPELLYAICSYHVGVRGWNDIGYNTLIDSSGRIWEGRGGGVDQPVRGAHAAGFNSASVGVAFIGDHNVAPPTAAAQDAFVTYAAWRMDVAHIDPRSVPVVISRDSPTYPDGVAVPLRAVSGHRDVGTTGCPGSIAYNLLGSLTERVLAVGGEHIYGGWPVADPIRGNRVEGYDPTAFDFEITSPADWDFQLIAPDGEVIISQQGTGSRGSITWAPDETFEWGTYVASLMATPTDGRPPPRPARFEFVLGDFTPPFFDDEESPHEDSIDRVYQLGITNGCDDMRFCPLGEVERWQMALFLTRLWAIAGMEPLMPEVPLFSDIDAYPSTTQSAIEELAALGITIGVGPDRFDPGAAVSRAQMAVFLDRTLRSLGVALSDESANLFDDLTDQPFEVVEAVRHLADLGVTTGTSERTYDPGGVVTREQMATFLSRAIASIPIESASP
jgi:hypothetical protein